MSDMVNNENTNDAGSILLDDEECKRIKKSAEELSLKAKQLIFDICDTSLYRLPGSEGERIGQEYIERKFKEIGADEVERQEFHVYPRFFRWWPTISLGFFLASMVAVHYSPLIALLLAVMMLVNVILKLLSFTFLDVLFKKKTSLNVIAKLKPASVKKGDGSKVKRIIAIGGHMDSTYEFPLGRKFGLKMVYFYLVALLIAVAWIFATFGLIIRRFIEHIPQFGWSPYWETFYWVFIGLAVVVSAIILNIVSGRPVPGANDNLSGLSVAYETLEYFASEQNRPKEIEVWAISFGSEEGGMMGSKALSKKIKSMMENGDLPADEFWMINFDSIGADGPLIIAKSEPVYRVKSHDPRVYGTMTAICKRLGISHKVDKIDAGTDSAPFSRLGIPAAGVICLGGEGTPAYWHCREDTPENVNPKGMEHSLMLTLGLIINEDKKLASE